MQQKETYQEEKKSPLFSRLLIFAPCCYGSTGEGSHWNGIKQGVAIATGSHILMAAIEAMAMGVQEAGLLIICRESAVERRALMACCQICSHCLFGVCARVIVFPCVCVFAWMCFRKGDCRRDDWNGFSICGSLVQLTFLRHESCCHLKSVICSSWKKNIAILVLRTEIAGQIWKKTEVMKRIGGGEICEITEKGFRVWFYSLFSNY